MIQQSYVYLCVTLSVYNFAQVNPHTGVYRIPCDDCSRCYICETKRDLTLRIREQQANCQNQKQHSAVVDHCATGWFTRAKVVNTQRSTSNSLVHMA